MNFENIVGQNFLQNFRKTAVPADMDFARPQIQKSLGPRETPIWAAKKLRLVDDGDFPGATQGRRLHRAGDVRLLGWLALLAGDQLAGQAGPGNCLKIFPGQESKGRQVDS